MLEPHDFEHLASQIAGYYCEPETRSAIDPREALRLVWNARGAADIVAAFSAEPPCPTFSQGEATDECKHCGWTEEAHDHASAIRALDR